MGIEKEIDKLLHVSELLEEELKSGKNFQHLTPKQLYCIQVINELNNPSLSELAKVLKLTKPTVTVMVDRLEENKYVNKIKSDKDKRTAHLHLTEKGLLAAQLHSNLHKLIAKKLSDRLNETEKQILEVLLKKALAGLK